MIRRLFTRNPTPHRLRFTCADPTFWRYNPAGVSCLCTEGMKL